MLVLAEQRRTFGYAVAASVALHALLLAMKAPPVHRVAPPEAPLVAHLVELPAPAPPPAPPPVVSEKLPQPAPPPRPKPRPKPKPKPRPAPAARASPVLPAPPPPAPPAALPVAPAEEAVAQPPAPPAPAAPPAPSPPAAVVAAPPRADPAAALARFREQLVQLAGRYKRYPRRAADNGWTGEVVVRVDIAAGGAIAAVRVKTSSGFDVLDAQALEMFRRAAPAVAVPPALRGQPFSVDVRAIYNLSDRPG